MLDTFRNGQASKETKKIQEKSSFPHTQIEAKTKKGLGLPPPLDQFQATPHHPSLGHHPLAGQRLPLL